MHHIQVDQMAQEIQQMELATNSAVVGNKTTVPQATMFNTGMCVH